MLLLYMTVRNRVYESCIIIPSRFSTVVPVNTQRKGNKIKRVAKYPNISTVCEDPSNEFLGQFKET